MSNTPSVTVHYAQAILQAAERLALPLPAELREPSREARIPLARQDELWEAFCAVAGDPLIGLRLGQCDDALGRPLGGLGKGRNGGGERRRHGAYFTVEPSIHAGCTAFAGSRKRRL